jgi:Ca2+-binding RTX toxin-like protein
LTVTLGSLPVDGLVTLADGVTAVTAGEVLSSAQLAGLLFTPAVGQFDTSSQLTYAVADPDGNTASGAATLAIGPAVGNPTVTLKGSNNTVFVPEGTVDTGTGGNTLLLGTGTTVVRSGGPDTIFGGQGSATIFGSSISDTVVAGSGSLTFNAGSGSSVVFGGGGKLTFVGGSGPQTVVGLNSVIDVNGGSGSGTYVASEGGTIVAGSGGPSILIGGNGAQLYSSGNATSMFGATSDGDLVMSGIHSSGDNIFFGQQGTGHLSFIASSGNDIMSVGQGENQVTLGEGHDTVFANTSLSSATNILAGIGSSDIVCGGVSTDIFISSQSGISRLINLFGFRLNSDHVVLSGSNAIGLQNSLDKQIELPQNSSQLTLSDGSKLVFVNSGVLSSQMFLAT